jgi:aminoglycoside phosphotransferase (APT) family kinase protein
MVGDTGAFLAVRPHIDVELVRRLIGSQFPHWSGLPIRPVAVDGWDNRTFHLGHQMTVRLPSGGFYALQVVKEQRWLPKLAGELPLPIPVPLAMGRPGDGYPFPWSVYQWIDAELATTDSFGDPAEFATSLAGFLGALGRIDVTDGPAPGMHNFFRGGPLATYHAETQQAIAELGAAVPADIANEIWQAALDATWEGKPVWFHGDVTPGNLLTRDGRLAAVIDFGCCGVGDPSCDLAIAWTTFAGDSRTAFCEAMNVDSGTWARGRGWALWKALKLYAGDVHARSAKAIGGQRTLEQIFAEYQAEG